MRVPHSCQPAAGPGGGGGRRRAVRRPGTWLRLLAFASIVLSGRAAEEPAIALPPFLVEEAAKGPPWRYASVPGYEILSRCDDGTTRRVVAAHHRLHQVLAAILPPSLQLQWSVPRTLLLYDEELQPAASQEVIRRMLRGKPEAPPVEIDLPGRRGPRLGAPERRISFLPNLRLWDRDGMAVFMIVRRDGFDPERLALTYDYVAFLLKHRVPALPAWFISGVLDLYRDSTFEGDTLRAPPLIWISEAHTNGLKKTPPAAPPVQPLASYLASELPATDNADYTPLQLWRAQAALLVRWGLDSRDHAHREAFFEFARRAAQEPATGALFRACFGFDLAAADNQLVAYLPQAVRRSPRFRPAKIEHPPAYTLDNATDAQVARIKGDWERLEVPFVQAIAPELGAKYLEQARRTLLRGVERAPADAPLRAVLALCEADAGNLSAAREHLESALQSGGPLRPRAAFELGRLRLAEAQATPAATDGRISSQQLAAVLTPLFQARQGQPALPEVYDLIGEAWAASEATATRAHLAVLDEGLRLFPRRTALMLAAAELNFRHGFHAHSARLMELALQSALDVPARARAERLRENLAAGASR